MKKTLFLSILVMLITFAAKAQTTFTVNDIKYKILTDDDTHTVQVGDGENSALQGVSTNSITIPATETYNGTAYTVTKIGDNAFNNMGGGTDLQTVAFEEGNSITVIGKNAFSNNTNLANINLEVCTKLTTISESAFEGTALEKITIPAGVTSIGNRAFNGICRLEITFKSFNPPTLGSNMFASSSLTGCTSPKLSLKLSQCANLTAFQEAFSAYIPDASNISGGASFPEFNPDLPPFNKDYDGTSVMTCNPAVEVTDDNGNIFTITAVTFLDNPTPGIMKNVRVKYNLKLASETDNCIEGAEVKLEYRGTISTGTTLILKNNTANNEFTIPGVDYEQSFESEDEFISITYKGNGVYQASVVDAAPADVYHFVNTDKYIDVTINVNRPYIIYQGETITLPGLTDLDKLSATDAAGNLVFGLKDPNNTSDLTYTLTATPTAATGDKTLEIKQNGVALCTIDVTVKEPHFKMQYTSTSGAEETKYFSSLADASTFVNVSTDIDKTKPITATLLNDYAGGDDEQSFLVDGGCTWILDLNTENPTTKKPYSMTGKCEFTIDNGNLTINADNEQTQLYAVFKSSTQNNPSLTINGGKYMSYTGDGIVSLGKAEAYINDGVFIDEYNGTGVCCVIIGDYCDITITKGIFRSLAMAIKVSYQRVPIVPITSKYYKITDDGEVEIANPDYSYGHLLDGAVRDDEGDIVDNPIKNLAIHEPYDAYAALTDEPDPNDATKTIKTLTFRYDEHRANYTNTFDMKSTYNPRFPAWLYDDDAKMGTQSVVFDKSFKSYYPLSCYSWFQGMKNISSITGLENLNTGKATGMAYMFSQCESLKSLDLSNFNTASVTEDDKDEPLALAGMFSGCLNLETIILGADFKPTANTKSLASMFGTCKKLTTIKVAANTNWNLDQIEDGESMFSTCYNIIGNDGTKLYPTGKSTAVGATDKTRAHVDEGGLFTTGDYVVLYDLNDENATIKNNKTVDNFTAGLTLPTATDVKNPGHTFKGWYRIDNGGDYYETDVNDEPVKSTEISANEIGNRIYRAEWELNYYTITFPTDVTNIGDAPYTNVADPTDPNIGKYAYDGTIKLNVTEGSYLYTYTDGDNKSQTVKIPTAGDDAYTFHVPPALAGSEITVVFNTSPFMVEGTFYSTFAEAVSNSRSRYYGDGKTIVQLMDYTVPETEAIEFMANQTLDVGIYKLDLGAKTLATYNSGEITIQGSTANGKTGTITSSNQTIKSECSKLYLKNVIIQTSSTCSDAQNGLAVIDGVSDSHKIYLYAGTKIEGTQSGAYIYPMDPGSVYLDEYAEAYSNGKLVLYDESGYGGNIIVGAEWGDDGRLPTSLDVRKAENFKATFKYSADGDEITKILPNFMQAVTEANYKDAGGNYPSSVTITMLKDFERTAGYFSPYGRTPIEISHINFNINFDEAFSDTCMIKVSGQKTLSVTGGADTKAYFQFEVGSGATLNLTGGTYDFYTDVIKIETNGTVKLNGVTFEGTTFGDSGPQTAYSDGRMLDDYPAFIDNNGGTLLIENGTYQYASEDDESPVVIDPSAPVAGYGVYTKAGETTINGGAFYGAVKQLNTSEPELKFFYPAYLEGGTTTITGGTFSGGKYGLYVSSGNTTAQKLQGGTYVGGTAAIYNEGGAALLTDGYAFYTSDGTKDTMLYYTGTNGGYVFEKYDENSKLLLTKDGSTDPITSVTVKAIVPVTNPSKFVLGKGAKYAFDIIGGAANTTYTFTSATEDVSDGETTTKETAVKVTYESGKYYVQTTDYAVVDKEYTLTSNENEKVEIKVTMMDFAAGLFDDNWHKSITIPSTNTEATGYNVAVSVNGVSLTANNDGNFVVDTEGADVSVAYTLTDNADNTYHSVTKTVKIDKTAPDAPYIKVGEQTYTGGTTTENATQIKLPENNAKVTVYATDNTGGSGIKEIIVGETSYSNEGEVAIRVSGDYSVRAVDEADNQTTSYYSITLATTYTVEYTNQKDGTTGSFTVFAGDKILSDKLPKTTGYDAEQYKFLGWFAENSDDAWNFDNDVVSSSLKLTGKWQYKVTFDGNGHDLTSTGDFVEHGNTANSIAPSPGNSVSSCLYLGDNWFYKDADGELKEWGTLYNTSNVITAPITLYANWKKSEFRVTKGSNLSFTNSNEATATNVANTFKYQYGQTVKFKCPDNYRITEGPTVEATDRNDQNEQITIPITTTKGDDGVYSFEVPCFNYALAVINITATTKRECPLSLTNMKTEYEYGKIGGCKVSYTASAGAEVDVTGNAGLSISYKRKLTDAENRVTYEDVDNIDNAAPGDYVKYFKYEDDNNIGETSAEFKIIKATPTVTPASDFTYDGTSHELVSVEPEGVEVLFSVNGGNYAEAIPSAKNAGSYQIKYKFDGTDNYNAIDETETTVTITTKAVYISIEGSISKIYDGTATLDIKGQAFIQDGELFTGDDVSITSATATFANAELLNTLQDVTITCQLSGQDADNYHIANRTAHGTISDINSTLTAGLGANIKVADLDGLSGLSLSSIKQGSETVTESGITLTSATDDNNKTIYQLKTTEATLTGDYTLTVQNENKKQVGKITLTVKDYTPKGVFDDDWHKSITIPSTNTLAESDFIDDENRPVYKVSVNNLTANNDGNFVVNTEGANVSVTYKITDQNPGTNTYHSVTKTVNIDRTAPECPTMKYNSAIVQNNDVLPVGAEITLVANDNNDVNSGIDNASYTIDAEYKTSIASPVTLSEIQDYRWVLNVKDNAGNRSEDCPAISFTVSNTIPTDKLKALISKNKQFDCNEYARTAATSQEYPNGVRLDGNDNSYLEYTDATTGDSFQIPVKTAYYNGNNTASHASDDDLTIKVTINGAIKMKKADENSYSVTTDYVAFDFEIEGCKITPYVITESAFMPPYSSMTTSSILTTEKTYDGSPTIAVKTDANGNPSVLTYKDGGPSCNAEGMDVSVIFARFIDANGNPISKVGEGYGAEVVFEVPEDYIFDNGTQSGNVKYTGSVVNGKIKNKEVALELVISNGGWSYGDYTYDENAAGYNTNFIQITKDGGNPLSDWEKVNVELYLEGTGYTPNGGSISIDNEDLAALGAGTYPAYVNVSMYNLLKSDAPAGTVYKESVKTNLVISPKSIDKTKLSIGFGSSAATTYSTTYDGTAQEPDVTVTYTDGTSTMTLPEYDLDYYNNINAGTATVTISPVSNGDYTFEAVSQTFTIAPKPITATVAAFSKTYDGNTTLPSGITASLEEGGVLTADAGKVSVSIVTTSNDYPYAYPDSKVATYTIPLLLKLSGDKSGNYELDNTITTDDGVVANAINVEGKIVKVTPTLHVGNHSYAYVPNGEWSAPESFGAFINDGSTAVEGSWTLLAKNESNEYAAITAPTASGSYKAKFTPKSTVADNINENTSGEFTITFERADAAITAAPTAKTGLVYSGSAQQLINAGTVTGGTMKYALSLNGTFDADINKVTGINAKSYYVYYMVEGNDNYNGVAASENNKVEASISPLSIRDNDDLDFSVNVPESGLTYNGTAQTPGVTVKYKNTTLAITTDYAVGYDNNINAGTNTATATISSVQNGNYDFGRGITRTFSIGKAPLKITPDAGQTKKYGKVDPALTYTYEPATLYATNDKITGNLTREAGENFGEYEIKQGTLSAGSNYAITVTTGVKFKITKADAPTITDEQKPTANRLSYGTLDAPEGKNLVYNSSAQQLVVAPAGTLPTGYTIKYAIKVEGSTAAFATAIPTATNAGTYTVLYMYDGGNNYEDISGNAYQIPVTIDKADITNVTAPEAITNLVYNGNDQALVTAGSTSVGTMKYSVGGNDYQAAIPTGNAAGEYNVKYMVAGNVNYNDYTPNVVIPVKIKGVYTIKFFDYDGTTLLGETSAVEDKIPVYPGTSNPTRPADKTYTYTFSGWNPKLYEANGNQDYKAQYSTTTNCFSVKANKNEFVYNDADQKPTLVVYTKPGDEEFTLIGDGAAPEYKVVWPQDVKNFGSKTVTVSGLGAFATCDAQVYTWTIAKAKYSEPDVVAEAETVKNKADGKITGVSSAMEYRKDGVANYTAIAEGESVISPLAPGTYYVRYKEDGNHLASDDKEVVVLASDKLLTVTFNSNGGTAVSSVSTEYGKTITAPTAPTKTGHDFDAWYTDGENFAANTKWDFATKQVTDDITLYANWKVQQHTVTFVFGNGDANLVITKDFGTDISALKPSDPVWRGHKFTGWNKEIPTTIPAEDVMITAQWEDETMQYVKFVTKWDDNTLTTYESFGAYPGESIEVTAPNAPERTGYLFQGWVTEDGQTATIPTVMPDNGMIIYADWKINQYTITFDTDGGTAIADIKQDYNTAITAPAAPSKTGYTFDYWTVDGVQTAIPATMPAKNITFKANWKINTYKIVFHLDNGDPDVVVEAEYGAPVTAPANFSKGNHTFDCWSRTVPATMPASEEPLEITALWIEDGKYVVKLLTENDLNEEVVVWSSQSYYEDEDIDYTSYADPTRDGYTFQGWATTADGQATTMPAKMPEGGATLYAKWGIKQYTITYNTNGGSAINETNTLKRDYNSAIPKPSDPSKTGNTFKGWFADSDCTTPCDFTNGKVTGDITLYAKWEVNTYTITFNSNGGSHVDPITQDYNSAIDAPANPSREGFEFMRWNPELPATMPAGGLDVTAVWQEAEPPVVNIVTINGIQVYPRDPEKPEVVVECIGSGEVKIEATDNSNVQPKVEYTVNGGESKLYEGPFTLDTHGEVAIKIVATDNVGNEADPIVVKAVVRREAALAAGSYAYTQLSGKDVVLEGFDLDGADIYSIVIDEKDEYKDLFVAETNSIDDQILNNVAVGKHTLHFYTSLNGNKHDTGIKDVELTVFGYPVMAEQLNINANGYCEDENADITLEFKNIDRPVWYKIKDVHTSYQEFKGVDKLAKDVGIMNFLVNGLPDGNLTLKATFTDDPDKNTESDTVTFNIKVNLPSGTIVQLFDDLIAIDNHDDLYTAFQWYKDGVLIEGADQQYYQVEGKLYGKYSAFVTISNGDKLKVCSADFGKDLSKSLKRSVNAYPNPARANEEITLELLNFDDAEYEGCVIKIVNAQGAAVATIDNCSRINTVSLPSGTYTGYVIRSGSNGDRVSFKLIVK